MCDTSYEADTYYTDQEILMQSYTEVVKKLGIDY